MLRKVAATPIRTGVRGFSRLDDKLSKFYDPVFVNQRVVDLQEKFASASDRQAQRVKDYRSSLGINEYNLLTSRKEEKISVQKVEFRVQNEELKLRTVEQRFENDFDYPIKLPLIQKQLDPLIGASGHVRSANQLEVVANSIQQKLELQVMGLFDEIRGEQYVLANLSKDLSLFNLIECLEEEGLKFVKALRGPDDSIVQILVEGEQKKATQFADDNGFKLLTEFEDPRLRTLVFSSTETHPTQSELFAQLSLVSGLLDFQAAEKYEILDQLTLDEALALYEKEKARFSHFDEVSLVARGPGEYENRVTLMKKEKDRLAEKKPLTHELTFSRSEKLESKSYVEYAATKHKLTGARLMQNLVRKGGEVPLDRLDTVSHSIVRKSKRYDRVFIACFSSIWEAKKALVFLKAQKVYDLLQVELLENKSIHWFDSELTQQIVDLMTKASSKPSEEQQDQDKASTETVKLNENLDSALRSRLRAEIRDYFSIFVVQKKSGIDKLAPKVKEDEASFARGLGRRVRFLANAQEEIETLRNRMILGKEKDAEDRELFLRKFFADFRGIGAPELARTIKEIGLEMGIKEPDCMAVEERFLSAKPRLVLSPSDSKSKIKALGRAHFSQASREVTDAEVNRERDLFSTSIRHRLTAEAFSKQSFIDSTIGRVQAQLNKGAIFSKVAHIHTGKNQIFVSDQELTEILEEIFGEEKAQEILTEANIAAEYDDFRLKGLSPHQIATLGVRGLDLTDYFEGVNAKMYKVEANSDIAKHLNRIILESNGALKSMIDTDGTIYLIHRKIPNGINYEPIFNSIYGATKALEKNGVQSTIFEQSFRQNYINSFISANIPKDQIERFGSLSIASVAHLNSLYREHCMLSNKRPKDMTVDKEFYTENGDVEVDEAVDIQNDRLDSGDSKVIHRLTEIEEAERLKDELLNSPLLDKDSLKSIDLYYKNPEMRKLIDSLRDMPVEERERAVETFWRKYKGTSPENVKLTERNLAKIENYLQKGTDENIEERFENLVKEEENSERIRQRRRVIRDGRKTIILTDPSPDSPVNDVTNGNYHFASKVGGDLTSHDPRKRVIIREAPIEDSEKDISERFVDHLKLKNKLQKQQLRERDYRLKKIIDSSRPGIYKVVMEDEKTESIDSFVKEVISSPFNEVGKFDGQTEGLEKINTFDLADMIEDQELDEAFIDLVEKEEIKYQPLSDKKRELITADPPIFNDNDEDEEEDDDELEEEYIKNLQELDVFGDIITDRIEATNGLTKAIQKEFRDAVKHQKVVKDASVDESEDIMFEDIRGMVSNRVLVDEESDNEVDENIDDDEYAVREKTPRKPRKLTIDELLALEANDDGEFEEDEDSDDEEEAPPAKPANAGGKKK